ncbi:MAG: cysteine methyltransferase [Candidatus Peribacteria bacterium]|nr:cysteine methyltransferase [Candidatus Peribacteria bacterium]
MKSFTPAQHHITIATPIGLLQVAGTEQAVTDIMFVEEAPTGPDSALSHLQDCATQLEEYFDGRRKEFQDVLLSFESSPFSWMVWHKLRQIPFGRVSTYSGLAQEVGREKAVRAVGSACRRNRFIIIVPCHRIVPSTLRLGNYAGGVHRKQWLLEHEERISSGEWTKE